MHNAADQADHNYQAFTNDFVQPPKSLQSTTLISPETYAEWYSRSLENPELFWAEIAQKETTWFQPWSKTFRQKDDTHWEWFVDGKMNITHDCLDRHIEQGRGEKIAFIALDENNDETRVTYRELLQKVKRFAYILQKQGITKGDRVIIYMPVIIEQVVAMLACARIGAIHSVVFAGFSAAALQLRIEDTEAKMLITSTWTQRRGKKIDLLTVARAAGAARATLQTIIVARTNEEIETLETLPNEFIAQKLESKAAENENEVDSTTPEIMESEDPLFILYTSGTTGKPKGIVHTCGGYHVYTHTTTKYTFDLHDDDIYWCTADPGWITGHSYMVYGPLSVGVTSIITEGAPDFPDAERWWRIVEKYRVNVLYTAPTAIRLLMKYGTEFSTRYNLSSLRVLGSVGEPINPAAWHWFDEFVGHHNASIVDTWWQTETGGHMLVTLPSMPQKPGSAGRPFFGIDPDVVDDHGNSCPTGQKGLLVIKKPWPSAFRTCWKNDERYRQYWLEFAPFYFTGDFAIRDEYGYIQVLGRSDDVLNVAGHRLGTAEVESALVSHEAVVEAAVIALPDELKGEQLIAFVTLQPGYDAENLAEPLREHVKTQIGRFAHIERFNFTAKLPKTRSGKIMRRLLRAEELGQDVGDTSTLED